MNPDDVYDFLASEGLTYSGAISALADKIAAFVHDGQGESLPRALELTRSLERLLSIRVHYGV